MPFRDFFILLGVLAATALITVVVVETAINQSVQTPAIPTNTENPIEVAEDDTTSNLPEPTPILTPTPADTDHVSNVPGEITSIRRYRVMVESSQILIRGQTYVGETGHIEVQEVRGATNSNTLQIPIVRIFSFSQTSQAPIFLLADGPGQTNLWSADIPVWLLNRHDIVMVGYRGMDGSVSLQLPEAQQALFDIRNAPLSDNSVNSLNQAVGRGLQRLTAAGVRLDHYTATDVVNDIDEVREAFEYASINLFAVGYGAQLAMLYGQHYPDHIARNILFAPPFELSDSNDIQQLSRRNFGDLVIKLSSIEQDAQQRSNGNQSSELISEVLASLNSGVTISSIQPISTPTLVLVGQQDWTSTREGINQVMSQLPNGALIELGDVGRTINDEAYFSTMFRNLISTFFGSGNIVTQ